MRGFWKHLIIGGLILAGSMAGFFMLFWQEPPSRWDVNRDQMLSPGEFTPAWNNLVRMVDLDSNGRITRTESQNFLQDKNSSIAKNLAMTQFFTRMDSNSDDILDYQELANTIAIKAYFDVIDHNRSGAIEFSETWRRPIGKFLFGKDHN